MVEIVQTLKRPLLALAIAGVLGAVASSGGLAAPGHGRFGSRAGLPGGFVPGPAFGAFLGGGPGGLPGFRRGFGVGPRGGALLGADVLTPAASFLGLPVSTLASDLKSGKTLAQEATARGKTATDLIAAIVAAEKAVLDNEKAAGWLTDAQETALLGMLSDAVTRLVDTGPPIPPTPRPGLLQTAATYLGVSLSQLQSDLRSGKTLAQEASTGSSPR